MASLYEEFTNDLLETSKTLFHELPLDSWNPQEVAAPERHISLRKDPLLQAIALLDQLNPAFARIEHMMRIYFAPTAELPLDNEKEQVWLFAYSWFSAYYDMLMEGAILQTEFYRKYHDILFELLRRCLQVDPAERPTFEGLLKQWPGTVAATVVPELSLVTVIPNNPSVAIPEVTAPEIATETPSLAPPSSASPLPPFSKRLVLLGHGGRKKTRRNPRS
jgi:serine/threonine protein kinase